MHAAVLIRTLDLGDIRYGQREHAPAIPDRHLLGIACAPRPSCGALDRSRRARDFERELGDAPLSGRASAGARFAAFVAATMPNC
jgi:hypothetical protein